MVFDAKWFAIGADIGGFRIYGDSDRYRIRWGDGQEEVVRKDLDYDADGTPDAAESIHVYDQDGTYDVAVFAVGSGLPPERFRAFLYSGASNDLNIGGTILDDLMTGGSGRDDFRGAGGDDTLGGGANNDKLNGQAGDDFLLGGEGDDLILGGAGSDLLAGSEGADLIQGGADRDFVYGQAGADKLYGDGGDDYLQGGAGSDRLFGGLDAGADTFVIAPPTDMNGNPLASDPDRDSIADFQQGIDTIQVSQWFGGGFEFLGDARFTGAGGELRFARVNGFTVVFGDVDGDTVADFSVRIETGATPLATDFT